MGPLPEAATVNEAAALLQTEMLEGCVEMEGATLTVRVAALLATEPQTPVISQT